MTEKRFYKTISEIEDYRVYDDDEEDAYFISCDEHTVDCLVGLLNELHDENKELKTKVDDKEVAVEVETCKVMEKIFDLIDRKIKDYNQQLDDEDIDDNLAYYMNVKGHIEAFKELKKELQE